MEFVRGRVLLGLGALAALGNAGVMTLGCGEVRRGQADGGDADARVGDAGAEAPDADASLPDASMAGCLIDFDTDCNVGAPGVCDTTWIGGFGCDSTTACSGVAPRAFWTEAGADIAIESSVDIHSVAVYFVHEGASEGTIEFYDVDGALVNTITSNADCLTDPGTGQTLGFAEPVRSALVSATGGRVWIDDFWINPE